jgi:hypothetical protein
MAQGAPGLGAGLQISPVEGCGQGPTGSPDNNRVDSSADRGVGGDSSAFQQLRQFELLFLDGGSAVGRLAVVAGWPQAMAWKCWRWGWCWSWPSAERNGTGPKEGGPGGNAWPPGSGLLGRSQRFADQP